MKNISLEVRLKEKTLSVNRKKLGLADSFFSAEVTRILKNNNKKALELNYNTKERDFIFNEGEKVYRFMIRLGRDYYVEVSYSFSESFSIITLVGEYKAKIYS